MAHPAALVSGVAFSKRQCEDVSLCPASFHLRGGAGFLFRGRGFAVIAYRRFAGRIRFTSRRCSVSPARRVFPASPHPRIPAPRGPFHAVARFGLFASSDRIGMKPRNAAPLHPLQQFMRRARHVHAGDRWATDRTAQLATAQTARLATLEQNCATFPSRRRGPATWR